MPAPILSSNLVTIPVLDTLLSASQTPAKRVQLLCTKLAILTNRPSQPARGQPFDVEIQILRCRLDLAATYLANTTTAVIRTAQVQSVSSGSTSSSRSGSGSGSVRSGNSGGKETMGELKLAETELGLVERECKNIIKRYSRLVKRERDRASGSSGAGDWEEEDGLVRGISRTSLAESNRSNGMQDDTKATKVGEKGLVKTPTPPTTAMPTPPPATTTVMGSPEIGTPKSQNPPTLSLSPTSSSAGHEPDPTPATTSTSTSPTPSAWSSTTNTTTTPPRSTETEPEIVTPPTKRQARLKLVIDTRVKGLRMMAQVEDRLGRADRKARCETLANRLESG